MQCTRSAWPYSKKQEYGHVIPTTTSLGLFGIFGQFNYAGMGLTLTSSRKEKNVIEANIHAAAKMAVIGLTETLAKEGVKYSIVVNWSVSLMHNMKISF